MAGVVVDIPGAVRVTGLAIGLTGSCGRGSIGLNSGRGAVTGAAIPPTKKRLVASHGIQAQL